MIQIDKTRNAFTMIELIFVIVIIGILAAVAIPKLTKNRDDAVASVCASEVGSILSSIRHRYGKDGYTKFQNVKIEDIFNGNLGVSSGDGKSGVTFAKGTKVATATAAAPLTYNCEGDKAVDISFAKNSSNPSIYELTIDTSSASTTVPAAIKAAKLIEKAQRLDSSTKTKILEL